MVTTYMPLAISQRFVKRKFDDTTRHKVKTILINEPPREKTNNVVSEQVRHKPGFTVTEAG